jgi:DNA-binding transcriptional ArsR family regulator
MLETSEALDRAFHALADATRRGILERLAQGPASVSELARPYRSSFAAIHQHIQVLETSGLVVTEKVGRTRTCHLARDALARLEHWLTERRELWESRFDRLERLLDSPDPAPGPDPDRRKP